MEDELATWRRRVDLLSQADELDAALFEPFKQLNQVSQRAPCPIQLPDDKCVSWPQICKGRGRVLFVQPSIQSSCPQTICHTSLL